MTGDEPGSDSAIATYRQIAGHFGLESGPDAGRLKAKRARWPVEPRNHPLDPVRVRVPHAAWNAVNSVRKGGNITVLEPDQAARLIEDLRVSLARLEARDTAELREVRALADRRGEDLAELRERLGRAEGEVQTLRDQVQAERDRSEAQARQGQQLQMERDAARAEAAAWTAGGPLARALRGLLFRRGGRGQ